MNASSKHPIDPVSAAVQELAASWQSNYQLSVDGGWWHFDPVVDRPLRRQGWKLHVSATPLTAAETLRRVSQVVMPYGLRWKTARSVEHLARLCAPPTPPAQVGKFVTVYLDEDDQLAVVAARLHDATRLMDAPVVPSDRRYRRGSNVYLRYGGFAAKPTYAGSDQVRHWYIVGPEGNRVPDERAPGRHRPSWVADPCGLPWKQRLRRRGTGLFGRDIEIRQPLHQSAKGGVYRGRWRGRDVVVKEGRLGTCPDSLGRDSTMRLRNEWTVLQRLAGTGLAPEPLDFFYEEGNAYLVEEFLPGSTLRKFVEAVNYGGRVDPLHLHLACQGVAALAAELRSHGVQPRDFTPNNILVHDGRYRVIDVELFEVSGSPEPPYVGWTPGYARPGHDGRPPDSADHEYAVAAIAHFILTGIDPYFGASADIAAHLDAVLAAFGPTDTTVVAADLKLVRSQLAGPTEIGQSGAGQLPAADRKARSEGRSVPRVSSDQILEEAVEAGEELVRRVEWDASCWPWPKAWSPKLFHPACFHSGTAGIARFYLDLWTATGDRQWLRHAEELLEWTHGRFPYVPGDTPPGLHFGLGALPWLMSELATSVAPGRRPVWRERARTLADAIASTRHESTDITHGLAGIGLTQVAMLLHSGDETRRTAATRIASRLLENAVEHDGLATWPKGDRYSYGFAHGSAGVGYFLLTYGTVTADTTAVDRALDVARALTRLGEPVAGGQGMAWRHGPGASGTPWTHWCNGAAGVGAYLLSAGVATGEPDLVDAAVRAGRAITAGRAFGSCCRCHGLAGDGDYLLDLAMHVDETGEFRHGAERIDRKLEALKIRDGFAWKWPHEGAGEPRPSYMRGYLGVHAFRLRLAGLLTHAPLTIPTTTGGQQ